MTVLAWDGKTLAADKRAMIGALQRTTTKIWKLGPRPEGTVLVGYSGDASDGEECLAWFEAGANPADLPNAGVQARALVFDLDALEGVIAPSNVVALRGVA